MFDTRIFDNCEGKKYTDTVPHIGSDWQLVHDANHIHVFKHNNGAYTAILSTDDDNFIRFCDVQKNKKSIYLYNGIYDCVNTYRDIIITCNNDKILKQKYNTDLPVCVKLDEKTAIRNVYRRVRATKERYSVPVFNNSKQWRTIADDFDSCTDYIIIPNIWNNDTWDSEEGYQEIYDYIEEFIYTTVGYRSCYDFPTGKMITISWGFQKTPCGVSVIHHRGIDW